MGNVASSQIHPGEPGAFSNASSNQDVARTSAASAHPPEMLLSTGNGPSLRGVVGLRTSDDRADRTVEVCRKGQALGTPSIGRFLEFLLRDPHH